MGVTWSAGDAGVVLGQRPGDQALGYWSGQEARDVTLRGGGEDAQAGEQRARRDEARAQAGNPEIARELLVPELAGVDGERARLELVGQAGRDEAAQLLGLRGDRVGVEADDALRPVGLEHAHQRDDEDAA